MNDRSPNQGWLALWLLLSGVSVYALCSMGSWNISQGSKDFLGIVGVLVLLVAGAWFFDKAHGYDWPDHYDG